MLRRYKYPLVFAAAFAAIAVAVMPRTTDWVIYNHSPSMPVGLYWRIKNEADATLSKGAIVTVRAKDVAPRMAVARHFDGPHNRFIKHVAALPGDRVCAQNQNLVINDGAPIVRRTKLHMGSAMKSDAPIWSGCRILRDGEVLLLGEMVDSFDGRYWGPVSTHLIEGIWRKL